MPIRDEENRSIRLKGVHYATGQTVLVELKDGIIASVTVCEDRMDEEDLAALPWIAPGLVDLQINGYNGCDYNTLPIRDADFIAASRGLWQEGITSYYPTLATNSDESIEAAAQVIADACNRDPLMARSIAGIHLEGPFISPEDGARGVHSKAYIRAPDPVLFRRWQQASGNRIRIVTLSPEWPESAAFIRECAAQGITVSIGHTSATPKQIGEAVAAGARMSTHLGNGTHLMLPRHPNYMWEQLACDELWTSVIADGFHLPDAVLKVVMKVKGKRAFVVSDASFVSGLPPGQYETSIGGKVKLTSEGRLHLARDERLLAGSARMQLHAVAHLERSGLASFAEAWEMCSIIPSRLMGLPTSEGLTIGAPADIVLLDRSALAAQVSQTYKQGILVFDRTCGHGGGGAF